MVCVCPCGKEYGFEPDGLWYCTGCWRLNRAGTPVPGSTVEMIQPEDAEARFRAGKDFIDDANAFVAAYPQSWKAWYALGMANACRCNLLQTGVFWTRTITLIEDDIEAERFMDRTLDMFVEIMIKERLKGMKYNAPHLTSMEYHYMNRFPYRRKGYCAELADRLTEASKDLPEEVRFSMVNLCSRIRVSSLPVRTDLTYHRDCLKRIVEEVDSFCFEKHLDDMRMKRDISRRSFQLSLWLTMPYRVALNDTEKLISNIREEDLSRLAAIQPKDGTAGFVKHLNTAIHMGGELAVMRSDRHRNKRRVMELEDRVFEEIREYLDQYISGKTESSPDCRVFTGPVDDSVLKL